MSFVIRFVMHNAESAVDLFQQNDAHKLMGKRHVGEADRFLRPVQYTPVQAQRTADDKHHIALSGNPQLFQVPGKPHAVRLFAVNGQRNAITVRTDMG